MMRRCQMQKWAIKPGRSWCPVTEYVDRQLLHGINAPNLQTGGIYTYTSADVRHLLPAPSCQRTCRQALFLPRLCAMWPFLWGIQIFLSGFWVNSRGRFSNTNSSLSNMVDPGASTLHYPPEHELRRWASAVVVWYRRLWGGAGGASDQLRNGSFVSTVTPGDGAQQE